tara:strand:+ start:527 stop:886 length:360 start_codon:yes stop_codon:yes gene_type:complete
MLNLIKNMFAKDELVVVQTAKKASSTRGRKTMTKKAKVLNLLSKGQPVFWKTLRSRFDLISPRAMVDQLRSEGHMIYINQNSGTNSNNTSYRMGTPTKAIVAAGIKKLYGTPYAYSNQA